jgi:16S rRNA (cytosine967-C5)-methyltransferase
MNMRGIGVKIIEEVYEKEHFLKDVLEGYFHAYEFEQTEKAFLNKLVYGTIEQQIKIDYIINQFSKTKVDKLKPFIYYVLSMSIYQMLEMTQVPHSAVCNEAVKLVKKRKMGNLSGYVNGVLRTIGREFKYIKYPEYETDPVQYFSVLYAMPIWLVSLLMAQYDEETIKKIGEDSLMSPNMTIRHNPLKCTKDELIAELAKYNLNVKSGELFDYAFKILGPINLKELPSFQDGYYLVQDESSMLASEVLKPQTGSKVLDLCAAPGGKTTHLAELIGETGTVVARDVSERKIALINMNIEKLGFKNIDCQVADATVYDHTIKEAFDYVLVDAPCSGLGILKKKPDIKRNMNEERIESLLIIQHNILNNAALYVKIGGVLVYSTCTINKQENRAQIDRFLTEHSDFELQTIELNHTLSSMQIEDGMLQLLPIDDLTDGFFIAKLKKV